MSINAKQYLRQVWRLDNMINAKLEQLDMLKSMTTKVTSTLTDIRVQESKSPDRVSELICKMIDFDKEITCDIDRLIDLKAEVMRKIDSISDEDYRLLLTLRYLNFKTWEQIAVEMNYAYSWVHKVHADALNEFDKLIPKEETKRDT